MYDSHNGLKNLYEVSCAELDFIVDYTKKLKYVVGSRMMGGGFGGMILVLVNDDTVLPEYPLVESSGPPTLEIIH